MNIRNEIKAYIVREGFTMSELVEKLAAQLVGEVGDAGAPSILLCQFLHQLAHGEALPDNVGFDFVPDIHNHVSFDNCIRHSA